jgi:hypothetical protein
MLYHKRVENLLKNDGRVYLKVYSNKDYRL